MVSADVERQAWLFQAGALRMLHRLTLARAAQRQRSSGAGSSSGTGGTAENVKTDAAATEAAETVSPGLQKQVWARSHDMDMKRQWVSDLNMRPVYARPDGETGRETMREDKSSQPQLCVTDHIPMAGPVC